MTCCFSEGEAGRLSSVVMSADIIKARCLPLQLNHAAMCDKSRVRLRSKLQHKTLTTESSVSSEVCDSVDDVRLSSSREQQTDNKRRQKKHKRRRDVNTSTSYDFTVTDRCHKVKDSGSDNKCHKQKDTRTADVTSIM